jgi:hypothetical protein
MLQMSDIALVQVMQACMEMSLINWDLTLFGARSGAVVEALRYKPEGRGIDSLWCRWTFSLT